MKMLKQISYIILNIIVFTFLVLLNFSCSKKAHHGNESVYTVNEINEKLIQAHVKESSEATKTLVLSDYGPGAKPDGSRGLEYKGLTFFIIQFEDVKSAEAEAKRLNEINVRNWLFDQVAKEPVLREMVQEHFLGLKSNIKMEKKPDHH